MTTTNERGETLVAGRALERAGFKGFHRCCMFWPSDGEVFAWATPEALEELRHPVRGKFLSIRSDATPPDGTDLDRLPVAQVKPIPFRDQGALALEESARLDKEIAKAKALATNIQREEALRLFKAGKVVEGDAILAKIKGDDATAAKRKS